MRADAAHERLLRLQRRDLDRRADADADEQRRAGIEAVARHDVEHELRHALIALARHQDLRMARQRAAAACHVGVDLAVIAARRDVPEDGRDALGHVLARVVFVERLDGVVTQRRVLRRLYDSFAQQVRQLCHIRERRAALDEELQRARILAARPVELHCELLIALHRLVDGLRQGLLFLFGELLNLCAHIIRQPLARKSHEFCHDICHVPYSFFSLHRHRSNLSSISCLSTRPTVPAGFVFFAFLILIIAASPS